MTISVSGSTAAVHSDTRTMRHRDACAAVIARGFGAGTAASGLPHRAGHGGVRNRHAEPSLVMGNTSERERTLHGSIAPTLALSGACSIELKDDTQAPGEGVPWLPQPAHSAEDRFGLEARR